MIELNLRLTHTYVGAYKYLDKWECIGSLDEIGMRDIPLDSDQQDDYTERKGREIFVLVTSDAPESDIATALCDTYTNQGCAHDYDCCGCRSYFADDVKRVTGNLWRVEVWSFRNY